MPINPNPHTQTLDALLYFRTEAIKAKLDADRDELCNAFIRPCPTQGLVDELISNGLLERSGDNLIRLTDAGTTMLQTEGNPGTQPAKKLRELCPAPETDTFSGEEFDEAMLELFRQDAQAFLALTDGYPNLQALHANHDKEAEKLIWRLATLSRFLKEGLTQATRKSTNNYQRYLAATRASHD